ncbi:hypothetical protein P4O66_001507 [Electrophorus voltai]|uniref:Uncharacterized protein n=1 Tax=Electrophorus voltai TaxID=2609070 RepID=A0AAD8Z9J6_9TELE|nr:hypothetical protein P4O66_001507 [Electrophorus voltai]
MDQNAESYAEGQKFYCDSCSNAGSDHSVAFHQSMEELPLEALLDVESEHSAASCMEVEASPVPEPTKGAHRSRAPTLPRKDSKKVQSVIWHVPPPPGQHPTRTAGVSMAPEPVVGGSSDKS